MNPYYAVANTGFGTEYKARLLAATIKPIIKIKENRKFLPLVFDEIRKLPEKHRRYVFAETKLTSDLRDAILKDIIPAILFLPPVHILFYLVRRIPIRRLQEFGRIYDEAQISRLRGTIDHRNALEFARNDKEMLNTLFEEIKSLNLKQQKEILHPDVLSRLPTDYLYELISRREFHLSLFKSQKERIVGHIATIEPNEMKRLVIKGIFSSPSSPLGQFFREQRGIFKTKEDSGSLKTLKNMLDTLPPSEAESEETNESGHSLSM